MYNETPYCLYIFSNDEQQTSLFFWFSTAKTAEEVDINPFSGNLLSTEEFNKLNIKIKIINGYFNLLTGGDIRPNILTQYTYNDLYTEEGTPCDISEIPNVKYIDGYGIVIGKLDYNDNLYIVSDDWKQD